MQISFRTAASCPVEIWFAYLVRSWSGIWAIYGDPSLVDFFTAWYLRAGRQADFRALTFVKKWKPCRKNYNRNVSQIPPNSKDL